MKSKPVRTANKNGRPRTSKHTFFLKPKQVQKHFLEFLFGSFSGQTNSDKKARFDVVTNTVSVDYLTKPLQVFQEIGRVLRPGGGGERLRLGRCEERGQKVFGFEEGL